MQVNHSHSQKARDLLAFVPFIGFMAFMFAFFAFLFLIFMTERVNTGDQATLVLVTSIINQGFSLAMFMAGYLYYRENTRAPFRKDDVNLPPSGDTQRG